MNRRLAFWVFLLVPASAFADEWERLHAAAQKAIAEGRPERAQRMYQAFLERRQEPRAYAALAEAYLAMGLAPEAEEAVREAIRRQKRPQYYAILGRSLEKQGLYPEALAAWEAVKKMAAEEDGFPTRKADRAIARLRLARRDADGALEILRGIPPEELLPEDRMGIARGHIQRGEWAAAASAWTELLAQQPNHAEARLALGVCQMMEGRHAEARKNLAAGTTPQSRLFLAILTAWEGRPARARALLAEIAEGEKAAGRAGSSVAAAARALSGAE